MAAKGKTSIPLVITCVTTVALLVIVLRNLTVNNSKATIELLARYKQMYTANVTRNPTLYEDLLDKNMILVFLDGSTLSEQKVMAILWENKHNIKKIHSWRLDISKMRINKDSAVVDVIEHLDYTFMNDEGRLARNRDLDVTRDTWRRRSGTWKIIETRFLSSDRVPVSQDGS